MNSTAVWLAFCMGNVDARDRFRGVVFYQWNARIATHANKTSFSSVRIYEWTLLMCGFIFVRMKENTNELILK